MFHHRWMSAGTWAKAIAHVYCISPLLTYDGEMLVNAVAKIKPLPAALNAISPVNDSGSISLHRNILLPKGQPQVHFFYAAPKGGEPTGDAGNAKWHQTVSIADDLLEIAITRSITASFKNTLNLIKTKTFISNNSNNKQKDVHNN